MTLHIYTKEERVFMTKSFLFHTYHPRVFVIKSFLLYKEGFKQRFFPFHKNCYDPIRRHINTNMYLQSWRGVLYSGSRAPRLIPPFGMVKLRLNP